MCYLQAHQTTKYRDSTQFRQENSFRGPLFFAFWRRRSFRTKGGRQTRGQKWTMGLEVPSAPEGPLMGKQLHRLTCLFLVFLHIHRGQKPLTLYTYSLPHLVNVGSQAEARVRFLSTYASYSWLFWEEGALNKTSSLDWRVGQIFLLNNWCGSVQITKAVPPWACGPGLEKKAS